MAFHEHASFELSTPLGKDASGEEVLLLTEFEAEEEISRPFVIRLKCESRTPDIDFDEIVGKEVTVTMRTGTEDRYFHGVVRQFRQESSTLRMSHYSLEIVPWIWLMTRVTDCRIFQDMGVQEILKDLFDKQLGNYEFALQKSYDAREYTTQYRESDLDFAMRLMEEEGMFFFFRHEEDKHTLVIADSADVHEFCPNREFVGFNVERDGVNTTTAVHALVREQQVRSRKFTLSDYDFEQPSSDLTVVEEGDRGIDGHDRYDYPGRYRVRDRGKHLVQSRFEEEWVGEITLIGRSDVREFAAGFKFTLEEHPRDDGELLLVKVVHRARQAADFEARGHNAGDALAYENTFVTVPASTPFRPQRITHRPIVEGIHTAVVVGPDAGELVHTDEYGRVKVRFHWDREGQADGEDSCWLRVSQARAGANWGSMLLPHIGQEVLVDFLVGDPDRPLVTGHVYNAEQMPPEPLPDAKFLTIIQDNFGNRVTFNAKPGCEGCDIHSPQGNSHIHIGFMGVVQWTSLNVMNVTVADKADCTIGESSWLSIGKSGSVKIGFDGSFFGGAKLSVAAAFAASVTIGSKLDVSHTNSVGFTFGHKCSYSKEKSVNLSDGGSTLATKKDLKCSADGTAWFVGGSADDSIMKLAKDETILSYGSVSAASIGAVAGLAGGAARVGAGLVAASIGAAGLWAADVAAKDAAMKAGGKVDDTLGRGAGFAGVMSVFGGGIAAAAAIASAAAGAFKADEAAAPTPEHSDPFGQVRLSKDGVEILSKSAKAAVDVRCDGKVNIIADEEVNLRAKKITLITTGDVEVDAATIKLKGAITHANFSIDK